MQRAQVIQEIANQLGIATTAVTKEIIPAYAQYQIYNGVWGAILFGIPFICALVLTVFFLKKGVAAKKSGDVDEKYDSSLYFTIGSIAGACTLFLFILCVSSTASIFLWANSPYGAFINVLLR